MEITTGRAKGAVNLLRVVGAVFAVVFCFQTANTFGRQERDARANRAKALARIEVDSGAELSDLDSFAISTLPVRCHCQRRAPLSSPSKRFSLVWTTRSPSPRRASGG
jgi:hypothetical protein